MRQRILIIGGGSGGTILANSLDQRKFEVTVLSASLGHLFQPALLYVAFANAKFRPVRNERSLLARHVDLKHDVVTQVNFNTRMVTCASGESYSYDYLVVATGIRTDPSQIPGLPKVAEQFGDYHSSLARAEKLWTNLDNFHGGTIVLGQSSPIIKCPPSPLEGILLAERLIKRNRLRDKTRLIFFTPFPRPYPAEPISQVIEPILKDRGIELFTFFDVDRIEPETRTIFSIEGDQIQYDLPIIIPPFIGADIKYEPSDVLDEDRLIITDSRSLRIIGTENAFAIGDGSNLPTSKAGVGAHLQAKVLAKTLAGSPAEFDGRTSCPFDTGDGRGLFVIGSYVAPVIKARPTRVKHLMKMAFERIYWISLRRTLDPMFNIYFRLTAPKPGPEKPN